MESIEGLDVKNFWLTLCEVHTFIPHSLAYQNPGGFSLAMRLASDNVNADDLTHSQKTLQDCGWALRIALILFLVTVDAQ